MLKAYLLASILILPSISIAEIAAHVGKYKFNTERVNGTPLGRNDLSYLTAYEVDCNSPDIILKEHNYINLQVPYYQDINNVSFDWGTAVENTYLCVKFTVTDTDGSTSKFSDLFILPTWNAPEPIVCLP